MMSDEPSIVSRLTSEVSLSMMHDSFMEFAKDLEEMRRLDSSCVSTAWPKSPSKGSLHVDENGDVFKFDGTHWILI